MSSLCFLHSPSPTTNKLHHHLLFAHGIKRQKEDDDVLEVEEKECINKMVVSKEMNKRVDAIKLMLDSMEDGEMSVSAYDTAWVALVEKEATTTSCSSDRQPQFPSSLRWIAENQLADGSWGDDTIFLAHDRIINTLACVVALKSWNLHPDKCERGLLFLKRNLSKLEDEDPGHMSIGFEVAFPSLLELARKLDIEFPEDYSHFLKSIYAQRDLKLKRIPKEMMHKVPTSLLHSLEGMELEGLDWEALLKLQNPDGSFLSSPSSTAFALMQTQDPNCYNYLKRAVDRFNGGVPTVYPVDLFEHMWVVDRLQRLGISRYFKEEIKQCMDYVHTYWTKKGIGWVRNSWISDVDDTAMGFRLLRQHGYHVSADVFKHFKNGAAFFSVKGQSTEAVTGMFNLYRASQLKFPGEKILDDANEYSSEFLREKRAGNQLLDKWIITKDLRGEVGYALDVPWYASLPRLETRFYLEHYGGDDQRGQDEKTHIFYYVHIEFRRGSCPSSPSRRFVHGDDDVWIGKTLYRMRNVNNNKFLELAKLDYNNCQSFYLSELDHIQRWYSQSEIGDLGISSRALLVAYFVAASSIYEPEKSRERIAWAKTTILVDTIDSFFNKQTSTIHQRRAFVRNFKNSATSSIGSQRWIPNQVGQGLIGTLLGTLNQMSLDGLIANGCPDIYSPLGDAWEKWMVSWMEEGDKYKHLADLIVKTIHFAGGHCLTAEDQSFSNHQPPNCYQRLSHLSNRLTHHFGHRQGVSPPQQQQVKEINGNSNVIQVEPEMEELVQLVFSDDGQLDREVKQTFFTVVRSLYYTAYCDSDTVDLHISKVLFERVN